MIEHLWLIPLGVAAGILGSMTGLGGGILTVPAMVFAGLPPTVAASNSLLATFSNAVASTISYSKQRRVEYRLGLKLSVFAIPGTIAGAVIASDAAPHYFKILFGIVLVVAAIYLMLHKRLDKNSSSAGRAPDHFSTFMMLFVVTASFFAGLASSFFGIGGGIVFVPLMVVGFGMSMKWAAPTSQMILIFVSASGAIAHGLLGHPDLLLAAFLASGSFTGGLIGSRLSIGAKERHLRLLAFIVIMTASVKLFYDSLIE